MTTEKDQLLLDEFEKITKEIEEKIYKDRSYMTSDEYHRKNNDLKYIVQRLEGCACGTRAIHLNAMMQALQRGETGVIKSFAPHILSSSWKDLKAFGAKIL